MNASSPRFALKAATSDAHDRLDALFSRFDLTSRDGYGNFLRAQAGAWFAVEDALECAGADRMIPDWAHRRRSAALCADVASLGLAPPRPVSAPAFADEAAVLGGAYVLEGSRLGGALLVRSVPDDLPKSFLAPGNPGAWRAFASILDERLSSGAALDSASASAAAVFKAFEMSARNILGADRP